MILKTKLTALLLDLNLGLAAKPNRYPISLPRESLLKREILTARSWKTNNKSKKFKEKWESSKKRIS
jgi:hypothetical protein